MPELIRKLMALCARNRRAVIILGAAAAFLGFYSIKHISLDALPDTSDTQVILWVKWDRPPRIIEDQVTYPLVTAMLGTADVETVRAQTMFNNAYVYVVFKDGTDLYWARSRALESLNTVLPRLPQGVQVSLGPDASSLGWIYQYALVDDSHKLNLADLRSLQDWFLRYQLLSVPGVSEVASIGGFVREYQVRLNPQALWQYGVAGSRVAEAVARSNRESGGRVVYKNGFEYLVRIRGYIRKLWKGVEDLKQVPVGANPKTGTPVLVRDVAQVGLGGALRRGVGELNGLGEAPGAVVVMRQGRNAYDVIQRVKEKLSELKTSLPKGVRVVPVYDRSELIGRAEHTLKGELFFQILIVSLVIFLFLAHIPSSLVPVAMIPLSILVAFIPMYWLGIGANIMSLSGLAISIGVMVDASIVLAENTYKKLEDWTEAGSVGDPRPIALNAISEVGPGAFFSLFVIAAAFIPIFALGGQTGRLFKPLAFTKTFAMAAAALLTVTLDPALRLTLLRFRNFSFKPAWLSRLADAVFVGRYTPEREHPLNMRLKALYEPVLTKVLERPGAIIAAAAAVILLSVPPLMLLGTEFMPPLNEGTILYMPSTLPGVSADEDGRALQIQDRIIKSFPEVESVYGKAGRIDTATDPAPLPMVETLIVLKPARLWPKMARGWFGKRRRTQSELVSELDRALKVPGYPNIWTQPIQNRTEMLSTGMRTPLGIKVHGPDLGVLNSIASRMEALLKTIPGTRNADAERPSLGYYANFAPDRESLARYDLTIDDVDAAAASSLGGETVTQTVEGVERYPVTVRYEPDFRQSIPQLNRILVKTPKGRLIPMGELGAWTMESGAADIRDEDGLLTAYVYIDLKTANIGGYVKRAKEAILKSILIPPDYTFEFTGEYKQMLADQKRLSAIVPLTLLLILFILFLNAGSWVEALIVLSAVPFSVVGAVWLMHILHYRLSVAVWAGMIAMMGLDAETGIFMLLYLDLARRAREARGALRTLDDLKASIHEGAVQRLRPKMMTVACAFSGLLPVMFSNGTGADLMKRIAAPMIGGLATSFLGELLVYPALYLLWRRRELGGVRGELAADEFGQPGGAPK